MNTVYEIDFGSKMEIHEKFRSVGNVFVGLSKSRDHEELQ